MREEHVTAYIDGFNLYHAIDALNQPYLKWVNLWALASSFMKEYQVLTAVNYYSAYASWLPDAHARHRQYTDALRCFGVTVQISEFRDRQQECYRCRNQWTSHEEKQTDVRMAVDIVSDCLEDKFDVANDPSVRCFRLIVHDLVGEISAACPCHSGLLCLYPPRRRDEPQRRGSRRSPG